MSYPTSHAPWPRATYRADWVPGATDDCAGCAERVEYVAEPDGPGGWRHRPAEQPTAELGRLIRPYGTPPPALQLCDPCDDEDRHGQCRGRGCECACRRPEVFAGPLPGCPAWCSRCYPGELHVGTVASIANPANPGQPVRVTLALMATGTEPAGICIDGAEQMSAGVALPLAAALLVAIGTVGR